MNRGLTVLATLLSVVFTLSAKEFVLDEKAFTIGTDLEVKDYGIVSERTLSLTRSFEITGKLPGSSSEEFFSSSTKYVVKDDHQRVLATITKEVISSFFTVAGNKYSITDNEGVKIAESELSSGWRPTITITENNGAKSVLVASGFRYYTWHITQDSSSKLDPRVLWIIAASKTAGDNDK